MCGSTQSLTHCYEQIHQLLSWKDSSYQLFVAYIFQRTGFEKVYKPKQRGVFFHEMFLISFTSLFQSFLAKYRAESTNIHLSTWGPWLCSATIFILVFQFLHTFWTLYNILSKEPWPHVVYPLTSSPQGVRTTGPRCLRSSLSARVSTMTLQSTFLSSTRRPSRSCTTCGCVSGSDTSQDQKYCLLYQRIQHKNKCQYFFRE